MAVVRAKRVALESAAAEVRRWGMGLDVYRADPKADANHHGMVCRKCFIEVGLNDGGNAHRCGTAIG